MIKNEAQVREIIEYYAGQRNPQEQENLVAMLREIQDGEGCVPAEVQNMAAEKLGIKAVILSCIIKRYPSLKEEAFCHEVVLCTGERCKNKNSMELLSYMRKELEIGKDGMSADKKIHLTTRNCLKQCRTSPNMLVDGELYQQMTKEKAAALLNFK